MLKSAAARFLERTETVRVRIPLAVDEADPDFDPAAREAFEAYEAALAHREKIEQDHQAAKEGKRKISDPAPVEPDLKAADAAIEEASAALDPYSILVVLEYRDQVYADVTNWTRSDEGKEASIYDMRLRLAEGLYSHVEEMGESGTWERVDGVDWLQVRAHTTDGEKGAIGQAAWDLCTSTGAAAPFKRRGKNSAAT